METFRANTPFEKELESILQASGQDTTITPKYDELPINQLTPEQVRCVFVFLNLVIDYEITLFLFCYFCYKVELIEYTGGNANSRVKKNEKVGVV
jgi:hypothetical protein